MEAMRGERGVPMFCRIRWVSKLAVALWLAMAGTCLAADLAALDRVSVNMDRTEVRGILGRPTLENTLGTGLAVDVYTLDGLEPLIGQGCVYSKENRLVGQAYVFEGALRGIVSETLEKEGFVLVEKRPEALLLSGRDDDTAQPILVSVSENGGMTTVVTFPEAFYRNTEKR